MNTRIFNGRNVSIFFGSILIILFAELWKNANQNSNAIPFVNIGVNIAVAVLTGLLVGIYFDIFSRKEVYDDMLHNFNISKEVISAGLINYYPSFNDFDFRTHLSKANTIDMYLTYGQTLFNNYNDTLIKLASTKGVEINIYLSHEDNIFIDALEQHWGNPNSKQTVKFKIDEIKTMLTSSFSELRKKKQLKAKVKLILVKRHPVFFSFYRFDNTLLLVPSKISHVKTVRPFAFLFQKTPEDNCVYNKCIAELESVRSETKFYEEYAF